MKPTWIPVSIALGCALGTFYEIIRPDRSWLSISGGVAATGAFLFIGWEWAVENDKL